MRYYMVNTKQNQISELVGLSESDIQELKVALNYLEAPIKIILGDMPRLNLEAAKNILYSYADPNNSERPIVEAVGSGLMGAHLNTGLYDTLSKARFTVQCDPEMTKSYWAWTDELTTDKIGPFETQGEAVKDYLLQRLPDEYKYLANKNQPIESGV